MPTIVSKSPSSKVLIDEGGGESVSTPIYLNVYDIVPVNKYLYWVGLGVFHSGIEVHGMEYGFGAHEYPFSGVFEVEPKSCPGFIYRRSVWLGTTKMSRSQFRVFIEDLSLKFHGCTYNLIKKNCNHFTDEVCKQLIGKHIPAWVNRLSRVGSLCSCILPESIQVDAVGQLPARPSCSDDGSDIFEISSIDDCDEEASCHKPLKKTHIDFVHPSDKPSDC